jgi:hypothetical protein
MGHVMTTEGATSKGTGTIGWSRKFMDNSERICKEAKQIFVTTNSKLH